MFYLWTFASPPLPGTSLSDEGSTREGVSLTELSSIPELFLSHTNKCAEGDREIIFLHHATQDVRIDDSTHPIRQCVVYLCAIASRLLLTCTPNDC